MKSQFSQIHVFDKGVVFKNLQFEKFAFLGPQKGIVV